MKALLSLTEHPKTKIVRLASAARPSSTKQKIAVPTSNGMIFIRIDEISVCIAEGNYTKIHYGQTGSLLISRTLKAVEHALPADLFIRAHQSYLVNINMIQSITHETLTIDTGVKIPLARNRRITVRDTLEINSINVL